LDGYKIYTSEEKANELLSNNIYPGDIILSKMGDPVGRACLIPDTHSRYVMCSDGIRLVVDERKHSKYFIYSFINSIQFRTLVEKTATGSTRKRIGLDELKNLPMGIPAEREEQQKIADCLSSLDALITAQADKLDALKTHKKGLMQQLFPREGETVPRLRFPEFQNAGEWSEKFVKDFFSVGSSKRVLQKDWTTQGVPFYRTRELVSLSKGEPFSSEIFISEELFAELSQKYGAPAEGDFLVSGVGTLGISYQVKKGDKFYFKDGNVLWFARRGGIDSTYFRCCFHSDWVQNQIFGQTSKSTVGTYTIQNAKKTTFWCPPHVDEQQKIADCLSSLDALITAQADKLDALKDHKIGLMQQLFPSPEAVGV